MADIARSLARFICESTPQSFPSAARHEGSRALLNWFGCVFGGCRADLLDRAFAVADRLSGPREASVLGRGRRVDIANAAFLNCYSSSLNAFDDTHLVSIAHPTGPVAAAILAIAEHQPVSGANFLNALLLGIEVECRMGCVLMEPPGDCSVAWTMTGLVGGIGAAAAVGKLLGLTEDQMTSALGIAATQAGGFRENLATMTRDFPMAQASRSGLIAALLAAEGFVTSERALDGPKGFAHVFAGTPNLAAATRDLGQRFELMNNAYKPYPCGIVIHPALDACMDLVHGHAFEAKDIESVKLRVHPDAVVVTGLKAPHDGTSAQVSLYHWVAAALVRRRAGLEETNDAAARDPVIKQVRDKIEVEIDDSFGRDGASVELRLTDGRVLHARVEHCRGSLARPLLDGELEEKFSMQSKGVITDSAARGLMELCWKIENLSDVGIEMRKILSAG
jgi:2-methylcitrate dehydratase PrpD